MKRLLLILIFLVFGHFIYAQSARKENDGKIKAESTSQFRSSKNQLTQPTVGEILQKQPMDNLSILHWENKLQKNTLLSEGFEGEDFPPEGWLNLDDDNDGFSWFSYSFSPHSGDQSAASASWLSPNALTPDNWLITPQVSIPASGDYVLEYFVGAQDPDWPEEKYGIFISTTGVETSDFTELFSETLSDGQWHFRSFDLDAFAGQDIYIAFRHYDCTDNFYLKIDDVLVREAPLEPVFSFSPQSIDFGQQIIDIETAVQSVLLSNTGAGTITLLPSNIYISGPDAGAFTLTNITETTELEAGQSVNIEVSFTPTEERMYSATLYIEDGLAGKTLNEIPLTGEGIDPSVSDFPWLEDFEDLQPGWFAFNMMGTATWALSNNNNHTPGGEISVYHNYATGDQEGWLVTPKIILPDLDMRLKFWSLNTFPTDYGKNSVLVSTGSFDPGDEEFEEIWTTVTVVNTWSETTIDLSAYAGQEIYLAFLYEGNNAHGWYLDDIVIEEIPIEPTFTINPESWDFGDVGVNDSSQPAIFTISNSGPGTLVVEAPVLDNQDDFELSYDTESFPASLTGSETVSFEVVFTPGAEGEVSGEVAIAYDTGGKESVTIPLSGNGVTRPAGSTCGNPYVISEFPVVDFEGDTEPMGDDYSSTWVAPSSLYLNGNDMVFEFTLNEAGYLSADISTLQSYIGLFILESCPDLENPPTPLKLAVSGTTTSTSFEDLLLPEGSYFAIASSWPAPQSVEFILNMSFEPLPENPVFSISPDPEEGELDFGNTPIGEQSDAQNFTIQNTGAGNLAIERIMLDGGDTGEFILTGAPDEDVFLSTGETFSFNVAFAPITEGLKETNLLILYADGEPEQSYSLTLRGTGLEPPAGSTCDNPYLLTLPVIDYIDNTEAYGDNYSSSWIDPSSSYLNGNDFVAQFTLAEQGYLSGSVLGDWTGVIIVEDCPDPDAPAEVLALGTGSEGGSFTDVLFQPGTYFAFVSTFPDPQFTDFTLNLSFEPLPDCVAPVDLTATDISTTSAILGWSPLGSETSWNIEWGLSGFVPGEATLVEGVDNPYVLTGLDPATSYDFYVQSICNGESSEWSGPFTFTTLCDVLALIDEDFELPEFPPLCWSLVSGSGNWARSTLASGYDVGEASARANFYSISGSVPFDMVTPEFAISSAKLTFDYAYATYVSEVDMLIILYSTDGGDSWELIEELEGGLDGPLNTGGASSSSFVPNEDQWGTLSYDLPEGTNKVKFQGISAFGNNLYLDNIIIEESGDEGITLDLKVILEGAYSPDLTELMLTQINDVLPLEQPFAPELPYFGNNNPVWYYEGDEAIAEVPDNVVDWVLVELRDAAAPSEAYTNTVVARKAALLLNTGEIVSADLNLPVFDVEISEGLYVVVYHRNHLAVMSAEALTEEDGTYSWDFTQAMNKAYRPQTKSSYGDGHKELGDGVFGMYGGDGDANGQIQAQDKNNVWNLQSGLAGYYPADFDLNGQVQAQDKNNIWNPNSGNGSAVPGDAK